MVLDEVRGCIGVHQALGNWFLITDPEAFERIKTTEVSEKELDCEELFRKFCHTIAIQERRNEKLQRNMLPLHFRAHMTEFQ